MFKKNEKMKDLKEERNWCQQTSRAGERKSFNLLWRIEIKVFSWQNLVERLTDSSKWMSRAGLLKLRFSKPFLD